MKQNKQYVDMTILQHYQKMEKYQPVEGIIFLIKWVTFHHFLKLLKFVLVIVIAQHLTEREMYIVGEIIILVKQGINHLHLEVNQCFYKVYKIKLYKYLLEVTFLQFFQWKDMYMLGEIIAMEIQETIHLLKEISL